MIYPADAPTPQRAAAPRRRALSTPTSSEGHASAVRIERRHGQQVMQTWAQPIKPAPVKAQPAASGCAPGFGCLHHPDCADHQCPGHPDNSADEQAFRQRHREELHALRQKQKQAANTATEADAYDLKGKDYSDHHGPRPIAEYHAEQARIGRHLRIAFWAGLAIIAAAIGSAVYRGM